MITQEQVIDIRGRLAGVNRGDVVADCLAVLEEYDRLKVTLTRLGFDVDEGIVDDPPLLLEYASRAVGIRICQGRPPRIEELLAI